MLYTMTKPLEQAFGTVRRLPPDIQDEIARAMLTLAGREGAERRRREAGVGREDRRETYCFFGVNDWLV